MGRHFHANGITVNKTTQPVESAAAGGACHIETVDGAAPLFRGLARAAP
jgi:hypothetical protein